MIKIKIQTPIILVSSACVNFQSSQIILHCYPNLCLNQNHNEQLTLVLCQSKGQSTNSFLFIAKFLAQNNFTTLAIVAPFPISLIFMLSNNDFWHGIKQTQSTPDVCQLSFSLLLLTLNFKSRALAFPCFLATELPEEVQERGHTQRLQQNKGREDKHMHRKTQNLWKWEQSGPCWYNDIIYQTPGVTAPLSSALVLSLCVHATNSICNILDDDSNKLLTINKIKSELTETKTFGINIIEKKSNTCTRQLYQYKLWCDKVTTWGTNMISTQILKEDAQTRGKGRIVLLLSEDWPFLLIHFHGRQKMATLQLPSLHLTARTMEKNHLS